MNEGAMKGVICYYSATGNTKLACLYIVNHAKGVIFDLFNIAKDDGLNLGLYDVVGFAAPTDFMGPPFIVKMFIDGIAVQNDKPAFVISTYGFYSGKTLIIFKDWISKKGFKVIAGHSLHTPENYPPMIVKGMKSEHAPGLKALNKFNDFILELNSLFNSGHIDELAEAKLSIGIMNSLSPVYPRTKARVDMGNKYVDDSLCSECGTCKTVCPYGAIRLDPKPVFNMDKCYGCWSCFNHCPNKAIYTEKIRNKGHYPKPIEKLREKLK